MDVVLEGDRKDDVLGNVIYRYALGSQASDQQPEILSKKGDSQSPKSPALRKKTIKAE